MELWQRSVLDPIWELWAFELNGKQPASGMDGKDPASGLSGTETAGVDDELTGGQCEAGGTSNELTAHSLTLEAGLHRQRHSLWRGSGEG